MSTFKNCILLVVFNWSDCVTNKNTIKKLYVTHFKQIIFYSDFPEKEDDEVTYIDIKMGYTTTKIFEHFYKFFFKLKLKEEKNHFKYSPTKNSFKSLSAISFFNFPT